MNRIALVLLLAASSLLSSEAIMASVEKCVDPQGRTHYGDHPPAGVDTTPVEIRPNVIETGPNVVPTVIDRPMPELTLPVEHARTRVRKDLESYVENCRNSRGVDCELEARQMIDGPAAVIFPRRSCCLPEAGPEIVAAGIDLEVYNHAVTDRHADRLMFRLALIRHVPTWILYRGFRG